MFIAFVLHLLKAVNCCIEIQADKILFISLTVLAKHSIKWWLDHLLQLDVVNEVVWSSVSDWDHSELISEGNGVAAELIDISKVPITLTRRRNRSPESGLIRRQRALLIAKGEHWLIVGFLLKINYLRLC